MKGHENRISILGVPIDLLEEKDFTSRIVELASLQGKHQIVFLNLRGLLKARGESEYARMVKSARLVIPTSRSIVAGARFLKLPEPQRYYPFDFIIKMLGAVEQNGGTLYLLGSRSRDLQKTFVNLRDSFPGVRLVGRYAGYFKSEVEKDIILAIRKAGPKILLAGDGLKGKALWLKRNEQSFGFGISLYCDDCFRIFSGKKRRLSKQAWEQDLWWIPGLLLRPWRWVLGFRYLRYGLLLGLEKFKNRKASDTHTLP